MRAREITRDSRLQGIDLRGALHTVRLEVVDARGAMVDGAMVFLRAGEDEEWSRPFFTDRGIVAATRTSPVFDIAVLAHNYRFVLFESVRSGERLTLQRPSLRARVHLDGRSSIAERFAPLIINGDLEWSDPDAPSSPVDCWWNGDELCARLPAPGDYVLKLRVERGDDFAPEVLSTFEVPFHVEDVEDLQEIDIELPRKLLNFVQSWTQDRR